MFEGSVESTQLDVNQISTSLPGTPDVASPDTNGPRYPEETDPSARLASLSEETWAVTTHRSISINENELDTRPSVSSGYLIKYGRASMGIRISHTDNDIDAKVLLKMYHDLTCLSQAKGFWEELPWHMAVARRAQAGLFDFG